MSWACTQSRKKGDMIMTIDQKILGTTTIVESKYGDGAKSSKGTGFFYSEIAKEAEGPVSKEGLGWHKIEGVWLITNRHVVFPRVNNVDGTYNELIPDSFSFNLREFREGKIEWVPIELSRDNLINRIKLHPLSYVDVVAIKIDDLQMDLIMKDPDRQFINSTNLSNQQLPSESPVKVECTSDIVVCSYPYDFYDKENKFPIVKSGIVASAWGSSFNSRPTFLIDAQLFPGSSGGLVLSKPIDMAMIDGKMMTSKEKQFIFLGIYSGQYSHTTIDAHGKENKESFGLGIVWYSYLIPQIIENGVAPNVK